jgi:hypothetical protein
MWKQRGLLLSSCFALVCALGLGLDATASWQSDGAYVVSDQEAGNVEGGFCLRMIYGTPTAILYNCGGFAKDGAVCPKIGQVMWLPFLGTLGYQSEEECTECGNECGWYDRIKSDSCSY